jgi:hypothetical protein
VYDGRDDEYVNGRGDRGAMEARVMAHRGNVPTRRRIRQMREAC